MCKYLCFPKPPISFFTFGHCASYWASWLCLIFAKVARLFIWTLSWSGSIALHSKPQIALACREHCTRSRALISCGPYISSLTVKGKHICCSWERRASTDVFLLVLVFPNKSAMCCVWFDWHMMCVPSFHCSKYQCPSVKSRSIFPLHP